MFDFTEPMLSGVRRPDPMLLTIPSTSIGSPSSVPVPCASIY